MTAIPSTSPAILPASPTAPRVQPQPEPAAPRLLPPNPSLRFDGTLSMLVLEFRDAKGEIARSIPTERELEAYRLASLRGQPHTDSPGSTPEAAGNKEASGEAA
jgi:hypothetical protein